MMLNPETPFAEKPLTEFDHAYLRMVADRAIKHMEDGHSMAETAKDFFLDVTALRSLISEYLDEVISDVDALNLDGVCCAD